MSVMIKGMQLPSGCNKCDLLEFFDGSDDTSCLISTNDWSGFVPDYRPKNCPLIKISTPHGRLIDADRLLESIKTNFYEHFGNYDSGQEFLLDLICNSIEDFPTIIEAEVSE